MTADIAYGIKANNSASLTVSGSGVVRGTAKGANTGVHFPGAISVQGADSQLVGEGGHTGVYAGGAIGVTGGSLEGTSHDAVIEDPGIRSGVYSALGGITLNGGSLTGTTNQYYTTQSGAVNANGMGVNVSGSGNVIEIYKTPYQTVDMTRYTTPFAGVSLTIDDDEFPLYDWTGSNTVTIDPALGVKALTSTGTASLEAVRSATEGNKVNMNLASGSDSHTVRFDVLLGPGTDPGVSHTVEFVPAGGQFVSATTPTLQKTANAEVTRQEALEQYAVTRSGYRFTGWAVNASNGSLHNFEASPYIVNDDVTFYAQWQPLHVVANVYYVLDGTENDETPVEVAAGCVLEEMPHGSIVETVPDPEDLDEKYQFVGCNLPYTLTWVELTQPFNITMRAVGPRFASQPNTIIMRYSERSSPVVNQPSSPFVSSEPLTEPAVRNTGMPQTGDMFPFTTTLLGAGAIIVAGCAAYRLKKKGTGIDR